jgi:hypothetical protein
MTVAAVHASESLPMNVRASQPPTRPLHRLARRGVLIMGMSVPLGYLLSVALENRFAHSLVYSVCITFFCWLFIDGGRVLAARYVPRRQAPEVSDGWPGLPWMAGIVPIGTLAGYGLGNSLAAWLLNDTNTLDVRILALTLFMALFIGVAVSYFFYSR